MRCRSDETLHNRKLPGRLFNLQNTIETRITRNLRIGDANALQKLHTHFVLHKELGEAAEHPAIVAAIPAEEHLVGSENGTHAIGGHIPVFQDMQEIIPELVFDKECHRGTHQPQEPPRIAHGVDGHVADDIGTLIVFPHLISRGRKEGEQDFVFGMLSAQTLHDGPSLFKLTQRGGMEPRILGGRVHLLFQYAETFALALPHLAHLLIEQAGYGHTSLDEIHNEMIHAYFKTSIAFLSRLKVSSLPRKAEMSNMPGPLPMPTSANRNAFITSPSL